MVFKNNSFSTHYFSFHTILVPIQYQLFFSLLCVVPVACRSFDYSKNNHPLVHVSLKNETDLRLYSYKSDTNAYFIAFLPYYVVSPSLKSYKTSLRLTPECSWMPPDSHISNIISSTYFCFTLELI